MRPSRHRLRARIWPENGDGPLFRIDATTAAGCTRTPTTATLPAGAPTSLTSSSGRSEGRPRLVFPSCALEVGDHDDPPGVALGDFRRAGDDRPVSCRAEPGRRRRSSAWRASAALPGGAIDVGTFVERQERDARRRRRSSIAVRGQLPRTIERARRTHAERPVDRDDPTGADGGRAGDVRPREGRGQQQQRDDAGGEQQQIAQPPPLRSLDRRAAQQADGAERHLRRDVAPQEVQHDRNRDRERCRAGTRG